MSYKSLAIFASAGFMGLLSVSASAATLHLDSVAPTASMTVTFPTMAAETTPYVGAINWSFDRSNPGNFMLDTLVTGSTLTAYCIEGTQNVNIGANSTFASILADPATAPQDDGLSAYQMGGLSAVTLSKFWNVHYGESLLNSVNASAFQLGVWEIVYDGNTGLNLSVGAFQAASVVGNTTSGDAFTQAQGWLSALPAANPTDHYQLYVLSDPALQDQVFGVQTFGNIPTVPLPAALPAGLSGLAGLALVRRFRKRPV